MEDLLPAYVTGELLPDEQELVRAALAQSPELREQLARYQQLLLVYMLAAEQDVAPPADLTQRITRQVMRYYYLDRLTYLAYDLVGAYGRALVFYLGLR
jgi:anti-sigma factor RsiW